MSPVYVGIFCTYVLLFVCIYDCRYEGVFYIMHRFVHVVFNLCKVFTVFDLRPFSRIGLCKTFEIPFSPE